MAGSHGKKDKVYAALIALMTEPGDPRSIASEIIRGDSDILSDEIEKLIEPYPKMDDRGVAIVFSSLVEIDLEKAVASHFSIPSADTTRLFSYPDGPLKEFSAKIAVGFALGAYDDRMNSDLKWVLRIRNAFAHSRIGLSFDTPAIRDACEQLKYPHRTILGKPISPPHSSRFRFALCVNMIRNHLGGANKGPLRFKDWPQYAATYSGWPEQPE
ncbi:MAG: hypothetical protein QOJ84_1329 [Bradyrhizobium sp.]|jgi:hypothetical protein|nr:hypothetical protein [Bradyrhizobium sp.]